LTPVPETTARRLAWWGVWVAVCLVHAWVAEQALDSALGDGASSQAPPAMDVTFVRELLPSAAPVLVAQSPAARPPPAVVQPASQPASSPQKAPPVDLPPVLPPLAQADLDLPAPAASADLPAEVDLPGGAAGTPPQQADVPVAAASAQPVPAAGAASAVALSASAPLMFDWPPSTRLSYLLTGNYRGPLFGKAQVEWLRQGTHYQVRLTVKVYPVFERRMLSDGQLGPQGLSPQRFDQQTDIPLQGTRAETVLFDREQIRLANGQHSLALPGVQDSASQFVQLSWLYLTRARRLAVGESVSFPLALPRRVGLWTYDVTEQVRLNLPLGPVEAFHLVPRLTGRKPNELSVQMWLAPSLQFLPVRITIEQDSETHLQLDLETPPLQAAGP
jgi:hypothetical protein